MNERERFCRTASCFGKTKLKDDAAGIFFPKERARGISESLGGIGSLIISNLDEWKRINCL